MNARLTQILEDLFSAGQVTAVAIHTGRELPKNYPDNRISEAYDAIKQLLIDARKDEVTNTMLSKCDCEAMRWYRSDRVEELIMKEKTSDRPAQR